MSSKVFITGLGTVSAAGKNIAETLSSFTSGGIAPALPSTCFKTELERPVFEIPDFIPAATDSNLLNSRTALLTYCAVRQALAEAGNPHLDKKSRIGICLGTTVASQLNNLEFYRSYRKDYNPDLKPVKDFLNSNLSHVMSGIFGIQGPAATIVNACSSGTDAIGTALGWIRSGLCDAAVAGGADELNLVPFCGFNSLGIMSEKPCRPFDRERDGLNLGEGAGVLFIESELSANRRSVAAEVELCSYGTACDAYHMTAPHPEGRGLKSAVKDALKSSGLTTRDIEFINAHGTATPDNDQVEGTAFFEIFGPDIRFFSTKALTGHTLGAAGGLEAVFTVLNLRERWIPASFGFSNPDPAIPLTPLTEKTEIRAGTAISTSLAFGGNNSALVFKLTDLKQG